MMTLVMLGLVTGCVRVGAFGPQDDGWSYELPQAAGECATDFGCALNGCGNHCTSAGAVSFIGACDYAAHNSYALCGCVRTECRWFIDASTMASSM